jgi:hypothetical protein
VRVIFNDEHHRLIFSMLLRSSSTWVSLIAGNMVRLPSAPAPDPGGSNAMSCSTRRSASTSRFYVPTASRALFAIIASWSRSTPLSLGRNRLPDKSFLAFVGQSVGSGVHPPCVTYGMKMPPA